MEIGETLCSRLAFLAQTQGEQICLSFFSQHGELTLSRRQLAGLIENYAQILIQQNIKGKDVVPVLADVGIDAAVAYLSLLHIGAIPCFMPFPNLKQNPESFWNAHIPVYQHMKAKSILISKDLESEFSDFFPYQNIDATIITIQVPGVDADNAPVYEHLSDRAKANEAALLQHSSGTTGTKKGLVLSHQQILNQVDSCAKAASINQESLTVSWLPLYHDMGLMAGFLLPLLSGSAVVLLSPFEWVSKPWLLLDIAEKSLATHLWMPNFAFIHCAKTAPKDKQWDLKNLKAIISCSEPVTENAIKVFVERFASSGISLRQFRVCYALAENTFAATITPADTIVQQDHKTGVMSCGMPIDGCQFKIVSPDEAGVGQVLLQGESLFEGYFERPELTRKKIVDGWYLTGDAGFVKNGELYITGRLDDRIISYGKTVHAFDLECLLGQDEAVKSGRVCVIGVDSELTGSTELVVLVELAHDAEQKQVTRRLKQLVQTHFSLMPKRIVYVPKLWLRKTTSGKMSRSENSEKYHQEYLQSRALI